jgi:hypothetical protein
MSIALWAIHQGRLCHTLSSLEGQSTGITSVDIDWHNTLTSTKSVQHLPILLHFRPLGKCQTQKPDRNWSLGYALGFPTFLVDGAIHLTVNDHTTTLTAIAHDLGTPTAGDAALFGIQRSAGQQIAGEIRVGKRTSAQSDQVRVHAA